MFPKAGTTNYSVFLLKSHKVSEHISYTMIYTTFLKEVIESLGSALLYVSKEGVTKVAPHFLASLATQKHIPAGFMINSLSNAFCYNSVKL